VYCATRYQHDAQFAYHLMDEAVTNAERYFERFNHQRTATQIFYRIISVIKRLSVERAKRNREIAKGTLSDLEFLARSHATRCGVEQDALVHQLLNRMTDRTRQIVSRRLAGHSWRQIARELGTNHIVVGRAARTEVRALLFPLRSTNTSGEREQSD